MAHNVKIKYYARENTKMTPHSWYGQPIPNGTYGFEQVCRQAAKNTSLEPGLIRTAVEEYMQVCMERLLDGFRVEVGNQFITLGPGLTAKVKDDLNQDGTVKKACTADDLTAIGARSRVTCTVNAEFTHEFNRSVRWQKTDKQGNPLEPDEDDATLDADDEQNQGGDGNQNGNQNGGNGEDEPLPGGGGGNGTLIDDPDGD